MALGTTLYWTNADTGAIEDVVFDAVTEISPEDVATPTTHPVERGVNIADHVRDEPARITIGATMANTPQITDSDAATSDLDIVVHAVPNGSTASIDLEVPTPPIQPDLAGLVTAGVGALGKAIFGGPKATVNEPGTAREFHLQAKAIQQSSPRSRIRDVYEKLIEAKESHALVTIITRDREYFDMLITRVAAPRTVEKGSATAFELDFERIRVADSETVESPQPAEARGKTTKNKGGQATGTKDPAGAQQIESTLSGIGTAVGVS